VTKRQKYRDVAKFLTTKGWGLTRQRGSHHIWHSTDGTMTISVPVHDGQVSAGVVRQIQAQFPDAPKEWN
jgi:predicted RNA binding protein YcfA (HicA-like mRNA interferase family)